MRDMFLAVTLSVILLATVYADKACSIWLHPIGPNECQCGSPLGTVVACNNQTQEVGILGSYCLTSTGDGNNTSIILGRCLAAIAHGERLLSETGNYIRKFMGHRLNRRAKHVATLTARGNYVVSVNLITQYLPILMIKCATHVHPVVGVM